MDGDLYPNDGQVLDFSQTTEDVKEERKDEEVEAYKSKPVFEKLLKEIDLAIKHYSSVESLNVNENTPTEEIKAIVLASKKMVEFLEVQKEAISNMAKLAKQRFAFWGMVGTLERSSQLPPRQRRNKT